MYEGRQRARYSSLNLKVFQNRDQEIITIRPGMMGGTPGNRGLSVTVCDVLDYLASGHHGSGDPADFPDLQADDVQPLSPLPLTASLFSLRA